MQSPNSDKIYDEYLLNNTSIRYTLKNQLLPEMELKLAKDEIDDYQIKTRIKLPLTGLDIWFGSVNTNIAFKEEYLKSNKDIEDAQHLRKVYSDMINEEEIKATKEKIKKLRL